jgi:hypothetical protein
MNDPKKNPSVAPVVIFGNNPPTIPPTKAPTPIRILAITPNNFCVGSTKKVRATNNVTKNQQNIRTKIWVNIDVKNVSCHK